MSVLVKYYKIRKVGTEQYYTGNKSRGALTWGPFSKGAIFTKHQVSQILRSWNRWKTLDLENIQVAEYDLLERRGLTTDEFFSKHARTPLISPRD